MDSTLESSLKELHLWLFKLARQFHRKYGGDFDDLMGQSILLFMFHFPRFDKNKGKLTTWMGWKVWYGLIDYNKRRWKLPLASLEDQEDIENMFSVRPERYFWLIDFLDTLGEDARIVVGLVLGANKTFAEILRKMEGFRIERRALVCHLEKQGWKEDRIYSAFQQVIYALAGITKDDFSWQVCFKEKV